MGTKNDAVCILEEALLMGLCSVLFCLFCLSHCLLQYRILKGEERKEDRGKLRGVGCCDKLAALKWREGSSPCRIPFTWEFSQESAGDLFPSQMTILVSGPLLIFFSPFSRAVLSNRIFCNDKNVPYVCCPVGDLRWLLSTRSMACATGELDFKYFILIHLNLYWSKYVWLVAMDRTAPELPSCPPHCHI